LLLFLEKEENTAPIRHYRGGVEEGMRGLELPLSRESSGAGSGGVFTPSGEDSYGEQGRVMGVELKQ
jgi:hypothetical protein